MGLSDCTFLKTGTVDRYELRYIRDKEGREVDFAIVKECELEELIKAKFLDDNISKSLLYYAKRLNPIISLPPGGRRSG